MLQLTKQCYSLQQTDEPSACEPACLKVSYGIGQLISSSENVTHIQNSDYEPYTHTNEFKK